MPFRYIALPPKKSLSSEAATSAEGSSSTADETAASTKKSKKPKLPQPLLPPGMIELLKKDNDSALDLF